MMAIHLWNGKSSKTILNLVKEITVVGGNHLFWGYFKYSTIRDRADLCMNIEEP